VTWTDPTDIVVEQDLSTAQFNSETVENLRWLRENVGWGPVAAPATSTAATATTTTTVIDAGLSITWTAVTGRTYEHRIDSHWLRDNADTVIRVLITDGSNNIQKRFDLTGVANIASYSALRWSETPSGGSTTRKIRLQRPASGGGSGNVSRFADSDRPSQYEIHDVGPA
jgi:hypothetical protein